MIRIAAVALVVAAAIAAGTAGAARRPPGPAAVVRAWTAALDRDDNEAAANLFAKNAVVVQNGLKLVLFTHHIAVLWMEGLPCSARIVKMAVKGDIADTTFVIGNRRKIKCDAPGIKARAIFRVRKGKIVAWAQVAVA